MSVTVTEGQIVFRQWTSDGLTEQTRTFASLHELYQLCLQAGNPNLIERVIIKGRDESGAERTLTFSFQSLSMELKDLLP